MFFSRDTGLKLFTALFMAALVAQAGPARAESMDFSLWNKILGKYRTAPAAGGTALLDYSAIGSDMDFKNLLQQLATFNVRQLKDVREKKSFWLNADNIMIVAFAAKNYPMKSIQDKTTYFSPVWNERAGVVGGKIYKLDELDMLELQTIADPMLRFGISRASIGSPDLPAVAFTPGNVDAELEESARIFLANPVKGLKLDRTSNTVTVSSIFSEYSKEFGGEEKIRELIIKFAPKESADYIRQNKPKIKYFEHDWGLNAAKKS